MNLHFFSFTTSSNLKSISSVFHCWISCRRASARVSHSDSSGILDTSVCQGKECVLESHMTTKMGRSYQPVMEKNMIVEDGVGIVDRM